jgi:release factor glutamine methyltransferase
MEPARVVRRGAGYLERHGVDAPLTTAAALMASVLGVEPAEVHRSRDGLTASQSKAFGRALCRRCSGVPTQHLTGEQGFRRLVLTVRPGVFVPRPETEILVEVALELLPATDAPIVVDACTGSGAVALAIADERRGTRMWATDRSADAVRLAREEARRLGLDVIVAPGDLLDPLPDSLYGRVDLVVANPPYVAEADRADLPPEVLADPPLALFGDDSLYERLGSQATGWLRHGGAIAVEIGETMGEEIQSVLQRAGFAQVRVRTDLAGRDRVVAARWP